ncbi:MAG TPA: amidohydrolase family protein [Longimicrobiales bacterium]|nr:amidohydrolase family protein [Longimicrobiales bacterium]
MKLRRWCAASMLSGLLAVPVVAQDAGVFDILITGGRVIDGTGNPWFSADVGIRDGRIVAVGKLSGAAATRTIDATGKFVTPGFIDIHSHGGEGLESDDVRRRRAPNVVTQGVTTLVINPDGGGPLSMADQKARLEEPGIGLNAILLVPHNTVRQEVLGDDHQRRATRAELDRMRALVRRGMEEGAFGLSAGLEYVPGIWSDNEEIIALVEEVLPFDGFYIQHERSGAGVPVWWVPSVHDPDEVGTGKYTLTDNITDLIEVAERTGARVVQTHLKAKGTDYWGASGAVIAAVNRARARGLEVYGDQYPYPTSGSDGRVVLIPEWARSDAGARAGSTPDYPSALSRTVADPERMDALRRDIEHEIRYRGGPANLVVFDYPDESYVGKSLAELAAARGQTPVEMAITLQLEGFPDRPGGARMRGFSFDEADIEALAAQPWVATASDGGISLPEDGPTTHARYYGTFPRKIRRYALERGVITVEGAIRAQTSLPAQIIGLRNRGRVQEGFWADVTVMDLERVRDLADFTDPHRLSEGFEHVLVNGQSVVDGEGNVTGALPGVVITPADGRAPPVAR